MFMADKFLGGKVAIVTGASSGIGKAIALRLAEQGSIVVLAARRVELLQAVAQEIRLQGHQALVVPTDVTSQSDVKALIQQTVAQYNRLDILVTSSGQYFRSYVAEMKLTDLEHSFGVNFYGAVACILEALPIFLDQHYGHIIVINTLDSQTPIPRDCPYISAKFALRGFCEVLRQELYGTGVYISTLYPGRIDTPMIENLKVPLISAKIPADDVAKAAIKALRNHPYQVIVPNQGKLLYYLYFFAPRFAEYLIRRFHLEGWEE
jgi:short-subunit dehydrogenase